MNEKQHERETTWIVVVDGRWVIIKAVGIDIGKWDFLNWVMKTEKVTFINGRHNTQLDIYIWL